MAGGTTWQAGKNTHENLIYVCGGGLSNTGLMTIRAALDVVDEHGLTKVGIGCLAALPTGLKPVLGKTAAARRVVVVDGCPNACAHKLVEKASVPIDACIVVSEDLDIQKTPLHTKVGDDFTPASACIKDEDVRRVRAAITAALFGS